MPHTTLSIRYCGTVCLIILCENCVVIFNDLRNRPSTSVIAMYALKKSMFL